MDMETVVVVGFVGFVVTALIAFLRNTAASERDAHPGGGSNPGTVDEGDWPPD